MPRTNANILLVTTTEIEARAVFNAVQAQFGRTLERRHMSGKTYYDLGMIEGASLFMVQSEMGSTGPGAALLTVQKGIDALAPNAVIMVGIAFGVNPKKQRIGDILVSRQLLLYELQRIGLNADQQMELRLRGDRPSASQPLLEKFRSGIYDWEAAFQNAPSGPDNTIDSTQKQPQVQFGLVLSGEKLLDHQDFRNQLLKLEPEAIGGEMEGAGLYVAAHERKVDWILVKAICDWADGNKSRNKKQRQELAARNAVAFTLHVLKHGGLVRQESIEYKPDSAGSAQQGNVAITNNAPNQGAQGIFNAPVTIGRTPPSHDRARDHNE